MLLAITPSTARADCRQAEAPDEVTCAKADVRLWVSKRTEAEADLALEQALTDRLTRELAACRETQGACEPRPTPAAPYPWNTVVTVGVVGVAVGVVLGVVLAL